MRIYLDADGCPAKKDIVRLAKRYGVPVTMISDPSHQLADGYSEIVTVEPGRDSVDFALTLRLQMGDIAVTQDYGVAAMALGKGARALHPSGLVFTDENIDRLLMERHMSGKARRRGVRAKGPKKRTVEDDQRLCAALEGLLQEGGDKPEG